MIIFIFGEQTRGDSLSATDYLKKLGLTFCRKKFETKLNFCILFFNNKTETKLNKFIINRLY